MRLSESLRRNIMKVSVSGILNRFKVNVRRSVLFFEDILATYIKECEDAGYGKEIEKITQKWGNLCTLRLIPSSLKMLPTPILLNLFFGRAWINLGLMEDLHVTKKNNIIKIKTKNEYITRIIGKNKSSLGAYIGILNILCKSHIKNISVSQQKQYCEYTFRVMNKAFSTKGKDKRIYDKLNSLPIIEGFTLKDALKKNILQLKNDNRLYFREKSIVTIENTFFPPHRYRIFL